MKFAEKIRNLRKEKGLSQAELARRIGVSARSVAAYESGASYPRYRETYEALAAALDTQTNYLRTEDEADGGDGFLEEIGERYGSRGKRQARAILEDAGRLFAGGDLSDEDKLAFVTELQQLFLDSKERARKFAPKKAPDRRQGR